MENWGTAKAGEVALVIRLCGGDSASSNSPAMGELARTGRLAGCLMRRKPGAVEMLSIAWQAMFSGRTPGKVALVRAPQGCGAFWYSSRAGVQEMDVFIQVPHA